MRIILALCISIASINARNWTVMVYLCADNSLADQALEDLQEMEVVGSGDDYAVVAQLDLPDQPAERLYVKKNGASHFPLGEVDMCDISTLCEFVTWAKINYPAKHYCLILWDHGSGWTYGGPKLGFGSDWSSNNTISFTEGEMAEAMMRIRKILDKKVDLLIFDACLLGLVEVAAEVEDNCQLMVASERLVPASGLPYDQVLGSLSANSGISPIKFGRDIVDYYYNLYHDSIKVNLALWDLSWFDRFRKDLDQVISERMQAPPLTDLPGRIIHPFSGYGDLGSVFGIIEPDFDLTGLIDYNKDYGDCSGCGIWFPDSYYDFRRSVLDYEKLNWSVSRWPGFLNFTYDRDDIPPTEPIVSKKGIKENNMMLYWHRSFDLASVDYLIYDAPDFRSVFYDHGDSSNWQLDGFSLTTEGYYSGDGNNLNNSMTLKTPIMTQAALFSFDLKYHIQALKDTLVVEFNVGGGWQRLAYYYGDDDWHHHQLLIRAGGNLRMRFRYRTDGSNSQGGAYLRDIKIADLGALRVVTRPLSDTSFYLYNQKRGRHNYLIEATDLYGNRGDIDDPVTADFADYAQPYSVPNPFHDGCRIIFDAPNGDVGIYIFTIDGREVRKISGMFNGQSCLWDGRDEQGKAVASGVYLILVKGKDFKRLGKIAKVE